MKKIVTEDGSATFFSQDFGQCYHSMSGAREEAREKYAAPGFLFLEEKIAGSLDILDIGFGLGYNTMETLRYFLARKKELAVRITALEYAAAPLEKLRDLHGRDPHPQIRKLANSIAGPDTGNSIHSSGNISLNLLRGDARETVRTLSGERFDLALLDGFSTKTNPELWTADFFACIRKLLRPHGALLTYSAAYPVISGLEEAGFLTGCTPAVGRTTGGTAALPAPSTKLTPVPRHRSEERKSTTGILPYRDPQLNSSRESILERYQREREQLLRSGVPTIRSYRKKQRNSQAPLPQD